ncbi:pituitary adenylate cyclase-activating polypeptide type I receptor-like [Silurus meridionalis]|uniref:pituitary adenylate cyclase-activating polypeptide type I receptor-like n=1 Tax=Silurus meridionalis TaxID=175797 RepID=UPI001EEAA57D|nr:pituitary adenylate cyclase-activating polypeptide type I receptor-like [Silurus meridionalis]
MFLNFRVLQKCLSLLAHYPTEKEKLLSNKFTVLNQCMPSNMRLKGFGKFVGLPSFVDKFSRPYEANPFPSKLWCERRSVRPLSYTETLEVTCKSAVAFFQFSILANYFWLLVEGMYLQTLLVLTFVLQRKYFWWYIRTGWGVPSVVLVVWVLTRNFYDNSGCWDDTDNIGMWWIIKGPITASLFANIIIFLNVIRILVEKLKSAGVGGNDTGHFMRLAKSTLFLIPLFGMHYTVFAFLPENTGETARLYIELGLGSFQGFVVALLYCFLNGERTPAPSGP